MKVREIILILLIRLLVLFIIGFLALTIIPNLSQFPYLDRLANSQLPSWIYSWGNFDGAHFVNIAKKGYDEFEQAFFPVYPILIRFVSIFIKDYVLSGLLISNVAFVLGTVFFVKCIEKLWSTSQSIWSLIFLLSFPTAFYFSGLYSESIFFALTVGALYATLEKKYVVAGILAAFSAGTRIQGIFIVIPLCALLFQQKSLKSTWWLLLSPFMGIGVYMGYLQQQYGDPLMFFKSISVYGEQRSTSLVLLPQVYYRYIKIFFNSDISFQYFVSVLEFVFVSVSLIIATLYTWKAYIEKKVVEISFGLFSFAHLILPTLTGSFSSLPRYSLMALTTYFYLASLKSTRVKVLITCCFVLLQILLLSFFIQGRFIS